MTTNFPLQAFSSLAEAAYENAETPDDKAEPDTYCLSGYFEQIVEKLVQTADRYEKKNLSCAVP